MITIEDDFLCFDVAANSAEAIFRHDPAGAAQRAEEAGNPALARDCWLLAGDPEGALACHAPVAIGEKAGLQSEMRLALTFVIDAPVDVRDLLAVVNPKITSIARKHPDALLRSMEITLSAEQARGLDLKDAVLSLPGLEWRGWLMMNATPFVHYAMSAPQPVLADCPGLRDLLGPIHRQAENALREDIGLPRVGESWISETELFLRIRDALGEETAVEQHGQPDGLGRQHLDVWLPDWRVGVEYQGIQHDAPVEFFGGIEAFEATKKRDRAKKSKCTRLGISLIEVRAGYDIGAVIASIRAVRARGGSRQ